MQQVKPNPVTIWTRVGAALAAACMASCLEPADQILERYGEGRIVFVKDPSVGSNANRDIAMAANPDEFHPGTDLMLLSPVSPTGKLINLTAQWTRSAENQADWGAAQDPEACFDGEHILFSMRLARTSTNRNQHWGLYQMNSDGTNLVRLTLPDVGDDFDPAYMDSSCSHVVFASTRNQIVDEYERRVAPQLFTGVIGSDGRLDSIRQITFNQSHDQNPFVQSSGKIIFTRWDHLGDPNKMPLFTINPDGTGQFVLYGADETFGAGNQSGSRAFMEARELRDGGLVASLMERTSEFEGGAICIIDLSKFTSPPQIITGPGTPYNDNKKSSIFKTPYPIMDGGVERILVAQSAHETGGKDDIVNYDLFIMDKDGGNLKLVYADPSSNDYDPVVLTPRSAPSRFTVDKNVAAGLKNKETTGFFFDANVYSRQDDGQLKGADLEGKVKYLRVLAAVPTPAHCGDCGQTMGHTSFERQRLLGYADVKSDGSFSIEVPANTPMHVQTLDEDGLMLVNQLQWIDVMPGERRMCTGCHGVREKDQDIKHFTIANDTVFFHKSESDSVGFLANFFSAQKVTAHPAARTDTVDFQPAKGDTGKVTVQGIFDSKCVSCHGMANAKEQGGGLVLEFDPADTARTNHGTTNVYETLTTGAHYQTATAIGDRNKMDYATDNGARQSPLAWVLYNRQLTNKSQNLFRTPSYDHTALWEKDADGHIDLFSKGNTDLRTLVEWMDMGVQFMNTVGHR